MSKPHIQVVNMIPKSLSGETNQDSEPQITVNPEDVRMIIGTAFTPDPAHGPQCPVYASFDGGHTFTLDLVIPGAGGFLWDTFDQSVRFGGGSALYAGILRGDGSNPLNILRSAPYSGSTVMQVLIQRNSIDQPYVAALHAEGKDRVFVGNNDVSSGSWLGSMEHSTDARNAPPPAGFSQSLMDPRVTIRDSPSIRPTIHHDGTVYAGYFSWRAGGPVTADVVVARDDNFAAGGSPFTSLTDTGDGKAGVRVALSVPIPWFFFMGNERVGSSLSIAVDPADSNVVYLAWGDGSSPGSTQTLHVRRSTDRGVTWSGDLVSVLNATNPALAVTRNGTRVGFMYQQIVTSAGSQRWESHLQVTEDAWASPADDITLANTPIDNATHLFDPYIGDYADLQSVHDDFYGVFCAHNFPDLGNFPHGVVYQRNANFGTNQLLDVNGVTPVANSIDPFFFHVSWHEEKLRKREECVFGRDRLEIKGLKYEKLEIGELKLDFGEFAGEEEHHEDHSLNRAIERLGHEIERIGKRLVIAAYKEEHHKH
jgi:hypothetical protein